MTLTYKNMHDVIAIQEPIYICGQRLTYVEECMRDKTPFVRLHFIDRTMKACIVAVVLDWPLDADLELYLELLTLDV